jgi:peptidoglycan-associated lipoprotein
MRRFLVMLMTAAVLTSCSQERGFENYYDRFDSHAMQEELENKIGDKIHFRFDSSSLTAEAKEILKGQARFMKQNPDLDFIIEGHCDERGTREYNLALGERRANSVKEYLRKQGINEDRLTVISYGKERPLSLGHNEEAYYNNRRSATLVK